MDWGTLVSGACGAVIALSGTLLADIRRDGEQRRRDRASERWRCYVDFLLALDAAHSALRDVARGLDDRSELRRAASGAVREAGVYSSRERLLTSGGQRVVKAGELAFARLFAIRDAVRSGATPDELEYHQAYHPFAEALWNLRMAIRVDLGQHTLAPGELDRMSWSEREGCPVCDKKCDTRNISKSD